MSERFASVVSAKIALYKYSPFPFLGWDWGLIWWLTVLLQCFDTVGWVTWPVKISSPNDLYCVEWDVKPYSTQLNSFPFLRKWTNRNSFIVFVTLNSCSRLFKVKTENKEKASKTFIFVKSQLDHFCGFLCVIVFLNYVEHRLKIDSFSWVDRDQRATIKPNGDLSHIKLVIDWLIDWHTHTHTANTLRMRQAHYEVNQYKDVCQTTHTVRCI